MSWWNLLSELIVEAEEVEEKEVLIDTTVQEKNITFPTDTKLYISKGKDHKKCEFGNKSSFVITKKSEIILGAMAFEGNPYDGHTLISQLEQVKESPGGKIKKAIVVRL